MEEESRQSKGVQAKLRVKTESFGAVDDTNAKTTIRDAAADAGKHTSSRHELGKGTREVGDRLETIKGELAEVTDSCRRYERERDTICACRCVHHDIIVTTERMLTDRRSSDGRVRTIW